MTDNNPYNKAHELVRALIQNETYQRYVTAQKNLAQNPEAKEKVRQFRSLQMEVNQAEILGQPVDDGKVQQITLDYAKLNRDKSIAELFQAEGMFIQMFTDIQQIIQKGIESGFTV